MSSILRPIRCMHNSSPEMRSPDMSNRTKGVTKIGLFSLPSKPISKVNFKSSIKLDQHTKESLERIFVDASEKGTDHGNSYAYELIFDLLVDSWN